MRSGSCTLALALVAALVLLCSPVAAQPYPQQHSGAQLDVGIFYDSLSSDGDWVEMPDYGWTFAPRVDRNWRPYTRGQWIMTDDGWYWDSDERFGWATYHYGRWVNHPYYGWVWVPGTEWAPAWVSWRHGNGYTGWAPLPPRATWQAHIGLNIGGLDIDAFLGPRDYNFVQDRSFVDRGVYQRVLPPTQNVTIINVTNNITNYTVVNQRVVNGGIPVANVERAVGRRVPHARTFDADRFDAPRRARADEITVYRPVVRQAPERRPANGKSLVKGDAPPPLLVERRKAREQETKQKGNEPELTAKDVQQRRPAAIPEKTTNAPDKPQTPRADAKTQQQDAQRERDQARQDADKKKANDQAQQAKDKKLAQDQAQLDAARQRAKDQEQQRLAREKSQAAEQQQREQARQEADKQRASDQNQQRLDREKRQAADQQQRERQQLDQQRAKRDTEAKAQTDKRTPPDAEPQAQADKRGKPATETQAEADKRAKDAKAKGKKTPKASPTPPPAEQRQ